MGIIKYGKSDKDPAFTQYIPKDELFDISFKHPAGLEVRERRGSYGSFIQAQIVDPSILKEKKMRSSITLTIYPKSKVKFKPVTAQGLSEDTKNKRLTLKDAKLLSSSKLSLKGLDAIDQTLTYSMINLWKRDAKLFPIKERMVYFEKGDNLYEIRLTDLEEDFDSNLMIFDKVLASLKFL